MIKKSFDGKDSDLFTEFAQQLTKRKVSCLVQAKITPEAENVVQGNLVDGFFDKYRRQIILEDDKGNRFTVACINATETNFAAQQVTFIINEDQCPDMRPLSTSELDNVIGQIEPENPENLRLLTTLRNNIDSPNLTASQKRVLFNSLKPLQDVRDERILSLIVDIIGLLKMEDSCQPLLEYTQHANQNARVRAVLRFRSLSELIKAMDIKKSTPIIKRLINLTEDQNVFVRIYSCEALGDILENNKKDEKAEAIDALIRRLPIQDEHEGDVRWAAAVALGRIGDPKPIIHLRHVFKSDPYDFAKIGAAWALGNIASIRQITNPNDMIVQVLREYLSEALMDEVAVTRDNAVRFLLRPDNRRFFLEVAKNLSSDLCFKVLADYVRVRPHEYGTRIEKTDIASMVVISGSKANQYFVAHAYDDETSQDLRATIKNALKDFGFEPFYADENLRKGHILEKIATMIRSTAFGIYEISEESETESANPNVVLELGMAIGYGKPYILIAKKGSEIISDLQGYDRIEYTDYTQLKEELQKKIKEFLLTSHPQDESVLS